MRRRGAMRAARSWPLRRRRLRPDRHRAARRACRVAVRGPSARDNRSLVGRGEVVACGARPRRRRSSRTLSRNPVFSARRTRSQGQAPAPRGTSKASGSPSRASRSISAPPGYPRPSRRAPLSNASSGCVVERRADDAVPAGDPGRRAGACGHRLRAGRGTAVRPRRARGRGMRHVRAGGRPA